MLKPPTAQAFQDIADYGHLPLTINSGDYQPGEPVPEAARYYQMALQVRDEFRQQIQHIKDSADFSTDGKQRRLAEVGTQYLPRLEMFRKFLDQLRLRLRTLKVSMSIAPVDSDAGARATRAREIRDNLPDDALEVKQLFIRAIEDGEQDVFDAIRLAPKFMRQVSDEDIADGIDAWQAKTDPENSKLARDLSRAIDALQTVVDAVASIIVSEANLPKQDPISRIAETGNPRASGLAMVGGTMTGPQILE